MGLQGRNVAHPRVAPMLVRKLWEDDHATDLTVSRLKFLVDGPQAVDMEGKEGWRPPVDESHDTISSLAVELDTTNIFCDAEVLLYPSK